MDNKDYKAQNPSSTQSRGDSIHNLKKIARFVFDVFKGFIFLFILAILLRIFVLQPFIVEGDSMEPNFYNKEYLLVEKVSHYFTDYKRGDVIILKYPQNQKLTFIKRIIGLPGERIEFTNGQIKIFNSQNPQGIILQEDYISMMTPTITTKKEPIILNSDEYFVMGDNRTNSLDSREFGSLTKKLIVGKTCFSFRTLHKIPKIQYNAFLPIFNKKLSFYF